MSVRSLRGRESCSYCSSRGARCLSGERYDGQSRRSLSSGPIAAVRQAPVAPEQFRFASRVTSAVWMCIVCNEIGCQEDGSRCLGLVLIELSIVAAAISTRMPKKLSAICIAISSEMFTSAM